VARLPSSPIGDDYEGRRVLPTVKVDADSRNIEELHVVRREALPPAPKVPDELVQLEAAGMEIAGYQGMMRRWKKALWSSTTSITSKMGAASGDLQARRVLRGIKEKYAVQKAAFPASSSAPRRAVCGASGPINFYRRSNVCEAPDLVLRPGARGDGGRAGGSGDRNLARRLWRETAMLLRHTTAEVKERSALTIIRLRPASRSGLCTPPWGYTTVANSHGSQGCCAYHRSALTKH